MARKYSLTDALLPAGLRVLAVEDETLIALDLQDMLIAAGALDVIIARCRVEVEQALSQIAEIDIAIIDLNPDPDGNSDLETARILAGAGIPFVIATGAHQQPVSSELSQALFVGKPYTRETIVAAVLETLRRANCSPHP